MRVGELLGVYHLRLLADTPEAVVGELRHVARNRDGGSLETPVGHLSAAVEPVEPEAAAHWRVDLFLRTDAEPRLIDRRLPEALADWLLEETACSMPLLLNVHEGRNTAFVRRGEIWDDD